MTIPRYAAHSPGPSQPLWEDQRTHRERVVAALARNGVTAGLSAAQAHLHDLGKYHPAFQAYIRASAAGLPAECAAALGERQALRGVVPDSPESTIGPDLRRSQ